MDEKEQADRMAAAEALYMISTRVDKGGGILQKSPRRSRKKKGNDVEDTTKVENGGDNMKMANAASSRGGGRGGKRLLVIVPTVARKESWAGRKAAVEYIALGQKGQKPNWTGNSNNKIVLIREGRAAEISGGGRGAGKGATGSSSSPRGRSETGGKSRGSTSRGQQRQSVDDYNEDNVQRTNNNIQYAQQQQRNSTRGGGKVAGSSPRGRGGEAGKAGRHSTKRQQRQSGDDYNEDNFKQTNNSQSYNHQQKRSDKLLLDGDSKRRSRSRTSKKRNSRTKSNSPSNSYDDYSHAPEDEDDDSYQAIGFTGAAISSNDAINRQNALESSQNLQSQSLVSGFRQVNLSSRGLASTASMYGLPSMNLTSFTSDLNLPSIPLEIGSLQLSSQPTPNLSSLGDLAEGVFEDDSTSVGRKNSEKFLPLKKRKLHNPSEAEVREANPPMDASSLSDSEERSEPQTPPPQQTEPVRASFTVQAPPIITMQTLMEIKTALTADDDGDLPLHIAVVHENMRMVIKLINLMRIAGKGVDKFNKQQQTPLHLAVKLNFLEAVDILLKSNANVNAVDCTGSSCIHMAVQGKSAECLTMLLERCPNADLNVRNFDGLTPLHIAVDNGDLQQVESLLKYNADIDVTDGKSGRTALFRAAESNQKAMVELLLNRGANPDVPNYAGVTTAMAAQGRNLHGVLKLLGLVATDKFTEYETKPSVLALESKVSPIYLGFPPTDNVAFSHSSPARGIKPTNPEIMCLIEPKVSKENAEITSNETKVFHNVFVVSQGQNNEKKSMSEPSSPEVKMDVTEEKDRERSGRSGLLSLPEGIFCHTDEDRGDKLCVQKGSAAANRQGGLLSALQARFLFPGGYSRVIKNAVPLVQREQKSVMLQIVPQPTSASVSIPNTVVSTLTSTSNAVSSNMLSKLSQLSSKLISPTPLVTSPSSATPLTNLPASSSDTVTLTGMQARLFQMLLKMYNIDQSSEASAVSNIARSPLSSVFPKLTLPQSSSLSHPTTSPSIASLYQKQDTVRQSCIQQIPKNCDEPLVSSQERDTGSGKSSQSSNQVPSSQHKQTGSGKSNNFHSSDNGASKERDHEKAEESPLNLSTTSNRQNNIDSDGRESITVCLTKSDVADSTSRTLHLQSSPDVAKGVKAGPSPVQQGAMGKVISIEILRISDSENGTKGSSDGNGQIEMLVLPTWQQKNIAGTSRQPEAACLVSVARTVNVASVPHDISSGKPLEHKPSGQLVAPALDFRHVSTGVSQKTTSFIRDYLSQQNPRSFHTQPSASTPQSSLQSSVPTVLDYAAETRNSTQKKQVITLTRNPPTTSTMGKAIGSPVSTTILLPAVSPKPIFLHQGQVIDLSKGKVTEHNVSAPKFTSSLLNPEASQGNIIGFSGAILSVVPSKMEVQDKPKESVCKEIMKKRGRKSLKSLQGLPLTIESGLGKINSETDEKLKKFLDAKKLENASSALPEIVDGMQYVQTNGIALEESEDIGARPESGLSIGKGGQIYKTFGIFSGNVQHVKVGKKLNTSPPQGTSALLSASSTAVLSPLGNTPSGNTKSGLNFYINADHTENFDVTFSKSIAAMNALSKSAILKSSSESSLKTSDNHRSNSPNMDPVYTTVSEDTESHLPKKSKRSRKSTSYVVINSKEKIASMLNKKGQSSDPANNGISEIGRLKSPKIEKISVTLNKELNSNQGQNRNAKSLLSSSLLQTLKKPEEKPDKSDNVQTILSDSDASQILNKRQRRKKSGPPGVEDVNKSVPVYTKKPHPAEGAKASAQAGAHASRNANILKAISASHKDIRRTGRAEISSMEVDDELEEQPPLCIAEPEDLD